MRETPGKALRKLLGRKQTLVKPGAYNALSAMIIEKAGFPCCGVTGYGVSAALLGKPDVGLLTLDEIVTATRYITRAVKIPVIADADTGFGNAINVMRTVEEFIAAGAAAIHIEDQVAPKRCGHIAGKQVVPLEEMAGKIRAADKVRRDLDPDFVLIARCDARGVAGGSVDDLVRRANAYLEAGADLAFVEGPTSVEEIRRVCREVHGPIFYNQTGLSPRLTPAEMADLGVAVTILPGAMLRVGLQALWDFAAALRQEGPAAEARFAERFKGHPVGDLHTFAGFDRIRAWEEAYLPAEELDKYEGSVGHQPTRT